MVPVPFGHASRRRFFLRRLVALLVAYLIGLAAGIPARAEADEAPLARAEAFFEEGRLYPAERAAREAIELDPADAAAHQLLGSILLLRRKPDEAVTSLGRARALAPLSPGLDRALGDAWLEQGDDERACQAYERALAAVPDDAQGQLRHSHCAARLGELELAEAALVRAARDPDYAQVALYQLGLVRARGGKRDAARDAFERAVMLDPPSTLAARAWAAVQELEQEERSWTLGAATGLVFDDNVTQTELGISTDEPDLATRLELEATWRPSLPDALPALELGYGLLQTRYFETRGLDLQSHAMSASLSRKLGPGTAALSYLYSLNTLDGVRFLDLQDIRPSYGFALKPTWYTTFSSALQIKRFEASPDRDAYAGSLGTLQLFDLSNGAWGRYLLLGIDAEFEDAEGRQFDARGLSTQAALHWGLILRERVLPLDLRYRFRLRDFLHDTTLRAAADEIPAITVSRRDAIHSFRARASHDLHRFASPGIGVSLQLEYEFEDSDSDLPSADYTQNVVTLMLRFAL